jgi:hypothetical protein
MEKESKEVVLPDFTEDAKQKYPNPYVCEGLDITPAYRDGFIDGANHAYLLGYNESHSKLKLRIEELEKIMKKANEMAKATDHLLTGLATDGNAIEGFTDAWKARQEFTAAQLLYAVHLVGEKRGISELKNTL